MSGDTVGPGMKAQGLCIDQLLDHGIPSPDVVQCMMKDIDEQLGDNNKQSVFIWSI